MIVLVVKNNLKIFPWWYKCKKILNVKIFLLYMKKIVLVNRDDIERGGA
jgi:hypothetical protein